jgi:Tol biopolymer transport system component
VGLTVLAVTGVSSEEQTAARVAEPRYKNPIVFGRTHLNAAGEPTLRSKIWIMDEDGSGLRQLTLGETYDDHPALYSDQEHVLYSEFAANRLDRAAGASLIRLNIYTGKRAVIHTVPGCALHHATVSPLSDDLIVYHQDCGKRYSLRLNWGPAGFELNTIAANGVAVGPDSVIFMHEKNRGHSPREVSLARIDGRGTNAKITLLTDDRVLHRRPAISADGQMLAWQTNAEGSQDEIFLAKVDGSGARNLTRHKGNDGHPWFSRDGKWIVFESDRSFIGRSRNGCEPMVACEIWKTNIETGETVQLTFGGKEFASTRPRM